MITHWAELRQWLKDEPQFGDITPHAVLTKMEQLDESMHRPESEDGKLGELIGQLTAHIHQWDILGTWRPATRAIHPRDTTDAVTIVLVRCRECNVPETVVLAGIWTEEQLTAQSKENQDVPGGR